MSLLKLITFVLVVVFGGGAKSLSLLPSLPLSLKRSLFYSVIPRERKKHLEILTCLIALIIFIKRLI